MRVFSILPKSLSSNAKFLGIFAVLILLLTYPLGFGRYIIKNTFYTPQLESSNLDGVKVALLSDLHVGWYKQDKFVQRVVDRTNNLNPDIVLITGDFVFGADPEKLATFLEPLKDLNTQTYAVMGNHDHGHGRSSNTDASMDMSEQVTSILTDVGIKVLDNEIIEVEVNEKKLKLAGIGSRYQEDDKTEILNGNKVDICMFHNPDTFDYLPNDSCALAVAGHTHGGQVRIPWLYKHVLPVDGDYDRGVYTKNGNTMVITGGLGEVELPIRMFNQPELVIIEAK